VVAKHGCLVRSGVELTSAEVATFDRGALLRVDEAATAHAGTMRLRIREPVEGWISRKCVVCVGAAPMQPQGRWAHDVAESGVARWAVRTESWSPVGGDQGPEWAFLVSLINEATERAGVAQYVRFEDKVRALLSRLLARRCCSLAMRLKHHDVEISRTKGRKPFLSASSRGRAKAAGKPNFNFNVSHEGAYVVLASEPVVIVGVDVAAPEQFRRGGEFDAVAFFATMKDMLSVKEWGHVRMCGDAKFQAERFRCFWSCKEAFTKARGDGLAFGLGKAEFDILVEEGPTLKFTATVSVNGLQLPLWRFDGIEITDGHVVTVSRGPPEDVVDAQGAFSGTFAKPFLSAGDFAAAEPAFDVLSVRDLVPEARLADYDAAVLRGAAPDGNPQPCPPPPPPR